MRASLQERPATRMPSNNSNKKKELRTKVALAPMASLLLLVAATRRDLLLPVKKLQVAAQASPLKAVLALEKHRPLRARSPRRTNPSSGRIRATNVILVNACW
jgi:hypothetical protein